MQRIRLNQAGWAQTVNLVFQTLQNTSAQQRITFSLELWWISRKLKQMRSGA